MATTLLVAAWRFYNDALPGQNDWATLNSQQTYPERTFPSNDLIGSGRVAEDARLWMPKDARYRIDIGAKYRGTPWDWAAPNFLAGFLFPRQRDEATTTRWLFCYGCDRAALRGRFHVLSDGENGVTFGTLTP